MKPPKYAKFTVYIDPRHFVQFVEAWEQVSEGFWTQNGPESSESLALGMDALEFAIEQLKEQIQEHGGGS